MIRLEFTKPSTDSMYREEGTPERPWEGVSGRAMKMWGGGTPGAHIL